MVPVAEEKVSPLGRVPLRLQATLVASTEPRAEVKKGAIDWEVVSQRGTGANEGDSARGFVGVAETGTEMKVVGVEELKWYPTVRVTGAKVGPDGVYATVAVQEPRAGRG